MRRSAAGLFFVLALLGLGACSGQKVEKVYKPGADNVFTVKGQNEQELYKKAREHCEGDFNVLKRGRVKDGDANLELLEFRCI